MVSGGGGVCVEGGGGPGGGGIGSGGGGGGGENVCVGVQEQPSAERVCNNHAKGVCKGRGGTGKEW